MDFELLNLKLLGHPLNWVFVWIILALAGMAFHLVHDAIMHPADASISPD